MPIVARADKGAGTGTNMATGATTRYTYQVDNGFMDGMYVGL